MEVVKTNINNHKNSRGDSLPRGYRNNNPLNVIHSSSKWNGLSDEQPDKNFCSFTSRMFGWRAALILLKRTYRKRGWDNLKAIIEHWAPETENDTKRYLRRVSHFMGDLDVNQRLGANDYLNLMKAMAIVENGYLDEEGLDEAWRNRRYYGCL